MKNKIDDTAEDLLVVVDEMLKVLRWRRYALYVALAIITGLLAVLWGMSVRCGL